METIIPTFDFAFHHNSLSYTQRPLPAVPQRSSSIYSDEEDIIDSYLNYLSSEDLSEPPMHSSTGPHVPQTQKLDAKMYRHSNLSSASLMTKNRDSHARVSSQQPIRRQSPRISAVGKSKVEEKNSTEDSRIYNANQKASRSSNAQYIAQRFSSRAVPSLLPGSSAKSFSPAASTPYLPRKSSLGKYVNGAEYTEPLQHESEGDSSIPEDQASYFESDSEDEHSSASFRSSIMSRFRKSSSKIDQQAFDKTSENKKQTVIGTPTYSRVTTYQGVVWPPARERREAIKKGHYIIYPSHSSTSLAPPSVYEEKAKRQAQGSARIFEDSRPAHAKLPVLSAVYAGGQYIGGALVSAGKGVLRNKAERRRAQLKKSITFIGNPNLSVSNTVNYRA